MSLSNNFHISAYITAFFDLLGFSQRLEKLDLLAKGSANIEQKIEIGDTFQVVELFRDTFIEFYNGTSKVTIGGHQPEHPIIHVFSDCLSISIPVDVKSNPLAFRKAFYLMLLASAGASIGVLVFKVPTPVRGGISIGYGGTIASGEVLSSGLLKSVKIEKNIAIYPRIVIDPEVVTIISAPPFLPEGWGPDDHKDVEALWSEINKLLLLDEDGFYFIDFLNPNIIGQLPAKNEYVIRIDKMLSPYFAPKSQFEYPFQGIAERQKWQWLATYWKSRRLLVEKIF